MLFAVSPQAIVLNSFLIAFIIIVFISALAPRLPLWAKTASVLIVVALVFLNFAKQRNADIRKLVPALTEVNGHDSLFDERIGWIEDNVGYDRVLLGEEGILLIDPDADLGYMYRFHHLNSYEPFTQTRWKLFVRSVMGAKEFDKRIERFIFYGIINDDIRDSFLREPRAVGLASLRYVAALGSFDENEMADGWSLVRGGSGAAPEFSIYENRFALPRAYLVNSYQVKPYGKAAVMAVRYRISTRPDSVLLENNAPSFPSAEPPSDPGKVRIKKYGINEVELEVEANESCLVVLTDCFYPGWKAFVDGEERPILRANTLFRAVEVAPGAHTIVFRYRPASLLWGAAISLASLFFIFAGLVVERRRSKTR